MTILGQQYNFICGMVVHLTFILYFVVFKDIPFFIRPASFVLIDVLIFKQTCT